MHNEFKVSNTSDTLVHHFCSVNAGKNGWTVTCKKIILKSLKLLLQIINLFGCDFLINKYSIRPLYVVKMFLKPFLSSVTYFMGAQILPNFGKAPLQRPSAMVPKVRIAPKMMPISKLGRSSMIRGDYRLRYP